MNAGTLISVEEYLKASYRPDCDYVDGVLEDRNVGEWDHSLMQARIIAFLMARSRETGVLAVPEWRFQVKATRFRVPDVTVIAGPPGEQILTKPPLLCIEILSPEDTVSKTNSRVQEYLSFGVPAVWVVDPAEKRIWIYRSNGMQEAAGNSIRVEGTSIDVPFSEIFD